MLCRDGGLTRAIAYGANSARGKLRGSAVVFCFGRAFLYTNPRTESTKITDLDAHSFFPTIREDLSKFYTASLWAELVLKSFGSGGDSESLFSVFHSSLAALDARAAKHADIVSIQFIWRFLGLAGSQPDLIHCACCGEHIGESDEVVYVSQEHGFCSVAHGCFEAGADTEGARWSGGALAYLRHTAHLELAEALKVVPPRGATRAFKQVLYLIIQDLVEVPLNTLKSGAGII